MKKAGEKEKRDQQGHHNMVDHHCTERIGSQQMIANDRNDRQSLDHINIIQPFFLNFHDQISLHLPKQFSRNQDEDRPKRIVRYFVTLRFQSGSL